MAITTLSGAVAGATGLKMYRKVNVSASSAGRIVSDFGFTGSPEAAPLLSASLNGAALTSRVGQLPFTNPVSGNTYLLSWTAGGIQATIIGTARQMLCDRLWEAQSGVGGIDITSTSAQSMTTPTWPARDRNAATNGDGVFVAWENTASLGTNNRTITLSYTNSAGVSGRTASAQIININAGLFIPFDLQAGDVGVRSIESFTLDGTMTSGSGRLVAYRPICAIHFDLHSTVADGLRLGFPRLYDDSVPFFVKFGSTGNDVHRGTIEFTQG